LAKLSGLTVAVNECASWNRRSISLKIDDAERPPEWVRLCHIGDLREQNDHLAKTRISPHFSVSGSVGAS
jgi:hypothetical protein